jgi:hypothetical protein
LLANATDPDGDTLSLIAVSSPSTNGATIAIYSNSVIYTPGNPDTNSIDSFTFTVADPYGAQATGTVLISVLNTTNLPPNITGIHLLPNGTVELDGTAAANQLYYVQVATNLAPPVIWVNVATNNADDGGALQYLDSSATNFPVRFYRFVSP